MKLLIKIITILLLSNPLLAQKEANIWYFGSNAGLNFNTSLPTALNDGQLVTLDSPSSIADSNGDLLFYTNGEDVWNKNHQIMNNGTGLLGDISSSQAALIVKKPGPNTIYYIFTTHSSTVGLHYSEVDMSLLGGLGAITNVKNVQLLPFNSEKITGVLHANGNDIWIVTHTAHSTNIFSSFLVTSFGVSSAITANVGVSPPNGLGYIKASPNGKNIAIALGFFCSIV